MLGLLVIDGIDPALARSFALIGTVGDEEPGDPDDGEHGEKNERKHFGTPSASRPFSEAVPAGKPLFIP